MAHMYILPITLRIVYIRFVSFILYLASLVFVLLNKTGNYVNHFKVRLIMDNRLLGTFLI